MNRTGIRFIEELAFNAWPSQKTLYYDGWLLRFADHTSRRVNSVNALYAPALNVAKKIAHCERVYRSLGKRVIFKLHAAVEPDDLDDLLERRGYALEAPTSVQTLALATFDDGDDGDHNTTATVETDLSDAWLETYGRLNGVEGARLQAMGRLLANAIPRGYYATLFDDEEAVAVGLGISEHEHLGLFDVVVDPARRQRGLGTRLTNCLLRYGKHDGASLAYLQVMLDNLPGLALYAKLGFREAYQYWYRVSSEDGA